MRNPLRLLRESLGQSQDAFGNDFGLLQPNVSAYEQGRALPADLILKIWRRHAKVCSRLEISLLELLEWGRPDA
jgi:transcriptional regulator with XRE-family HTH domain